MFMWPSMASMLSLTPDRKGSLSSWPSRASWERSSRSSEKCCAEKRREEKRDDFN